MSRANRAYAASSFGYRTPRNPVTASGSRSASSAAAPVRRPLVDRPDHLAGVPIAEGALAAVPRRHQPAQEPGAAHQAQLPVARGHVPLDVAAQHVERRPVQVLVRDPVPARAVDPEALPVARVLALARELVGDEDLVLDRHRPVQVVDGGGHEGRRRRAHPLDGVQVARRRRPRRPTPRSPAAAAPASACADSPRPSARARARPPRGRPAARAAAGSSPPPARSARRPSRPPPAPRRWRRGPGRAGRPAGWPRRAAGDGADRALHGLQAAAGSSRAARRRRAARRWRRCGRPGRAWRRPKSVASRPPGRVSAFARSRRSSGWAASPVRMSVVGRRWVSITAAVRAGDARRRARAHSIGSRPMIRSASPAAISAGSGTAPSCITTWLKTPPPRCAMPLRWKTSTSGHSPAAASIRMRPATPIPMPPTPARWTRYGPSPRGTSGAGGGVSSACGRSAAAASGGS